MVLIVQWKDNIVLRVASNHIPCESVRKAKRFCRKSSSQITVGIPQTIYYYNKLMGGVGLFDKTIRC